MKRIILLALTLLSTQVQAATGDEDSQGLSFDAIVGRLSQSESSRISPPQDLLDQVKIHLGVGVINSFFSIPDLEGGQVYASPRGYQATLGIDLFSEHWVAEGSVISFGETKYERATIGLREFDMRIAYAHPLTRTLSLRFGGGLAARYLKVHYEGPSTHFEREYTTPSSIGSGGFEVALSDKFSMGAEVSTRNALIDETPDQAALDIAFRLDGRF